MHFPAPLRALPLLGLLLLAGHPVQAQQDAPKPQRATVTGRVVEAASGAAVAGALVLFSRQDGRAVTDSAGRFRLTVPAGTHRLEVSRIGYVTLKEEVPVRDGDSLLVSVMSRPLVLEGLTVTESRLERRSRNSGYAVRAVEREQILNSAYSNAEDLAKFRLGLSTCGTLPNGMDCVFVRGQQVPVRVYIDDRTGMGGLDELRTYSTADVYRVEWFPSLAMLRVYTNWFVEDLARRRRTLMPVFY